MTTPNKEVASASVKNKQRITLFVNPAILKHARAQAIIEELSLTSIVEKALLKYLPREILISAADIKVNFQR